MCFTSLSLFERPLSESPNLFILYDLWFMSMSRLKPTIPQLQRAERMYKVLRYSLIIELHNKVISNYLSKTLISNNYLTFNVSVSNIEIILFE